MIAVAVIDLIIIIFLMRRNGNLAIQKGTTPSTWKVNTVIAWLAGRTIGTLLGLLLFSNSKLVGAYWIGLVLAIAGYLIVNTTLDKKPDLNNEDNNKANDLEFPQNQ